MIATWIVRAVAGLGHVSDPVAAARQLGVRPGQVEIARALLARREGEPGAWRCPACGRVPPPHRREQHRAGRDPSDLDCPAQDVRAAGEQRAGREPVPTAELRW